MNDLTPATGTSVPQAAQLRSVAEIETVHASRYLQQLCKHFAHKTEVSYDAQQGRIALQAGDCSLAAADGRLVLTVSGADLAALDRLEDVVARHLVRFAFREEMRIDWRAG